jgi:ABC-type Fe3+ transport system substrate-binding protein
MSSFMKILVGAALGGAVLAATPVQAQTAAEKLYAALAGLPQAERIKRLEEGAKKEGSFRYIQTITGNDGKQHGDIFAKKYNFLKIEFSQMDSQDGSERMIVEETAGKHLTDVVSNAVPDLGRAMKLGVTAVYKTPMTDKVLPQYKSLLDPAGKYTPWYWSEHGITYNTREVKGGDIPHSWMDLCKPSLRGKVSYDPAEVRFMVGLYFVFEKDVKKLEAFLKCVGENKPVIQNGHTARMTLMLAGDHAVGGDQYLYYGYSQSVKNPEKAPFGAAFDAPIMAYAAGVTINKNTPNPHAAALFTDWTLDEDSQKYMAGLMRGPLTIPHPFIPASAPLVPFIYVEPELSNSFVDLWNKYIGKGGGG